MPDRVETTFDLAIAYQYFLSLDPNELDAAWSGLISGALAHRILSCAHDLPPSTITSFTSIAAHVVKSDSTLMRVITRLNSDAIHSIFARALTLSSPLLRQMAASNLTRDELAARQMQTYDWKGGLATALSGTKRRTTKSMHKGYCRNSSSDDLALEGSTPASSSLVISQPSLAEHSTQPPTLVELSTFPHLPLVPQLLLPLNPNPGELQLVTTLDPTLDMRIPLAPLQIPTLPTALPSAPCLVSPPTPSPQPKSKPKPKPGRKAPLKAKATSANLDGKPKPKRGRKSDTDVENIDPKAEKPKPRRRRKTAPQDDGEDEEADPTFGAPPKKAALRRRKSMPAGDASGSARRSGRLSLGI